MSAQSEHRADGDTRTRAGVRRVARDFGLTPAETRLLQCLVAGDRVADAATALGISVYTARYQLKRVLRKTGMHRQIDLLRLCLGLNLRLRERG